jgi:hypothetical protein
LADIFTVTAPLLLRLPDGTQCVLAEVFRHPEGLLYFDIYRDRLPGKSRGRGRGKSGDA